MSEWYYDLLVHLPGPKKLRVNTKFFTNFFTMESWVNLIEGGKNTKYV